MDDVLSILLVDDNPDDRALVARELQREFPGVRVQQIIDAKGMERVLEAGDFDLVITDYQLRWTDGLAVLSAIKERCPECPVIMFTGTGTEEVAVQAMKAGLDDYIIKTPQHFGRLPGVIRSSLEGIRQRRLLKETEGALRLLGATAEQVSDSIIVTGKDFKITYVNKAAKELFGYTLQELEGQTPDILNAEPSSEDIQNDLYRRVSLGASYSGVCLNRRKDGTTFICEFKVTPMWDEGGICGYIGIQRDITERRRAEELLRESEEKYRLLLENAGMGIGYYDLEGNILFLNLRAASYLFGDPDEFAGKAADEVFGQEWGSRIRRRIAEISRSGVVRQYEDEVTLPAGQRCFSSTYGSISDAGGDIIGVQIISHDITDRKEMEETLRRSETQLRALSARLSRVEEEERRRLARELHDRVGQNLTALSLNLNIVRGHLVSEQAAERLEDSLRLLEETVERVRDVMADLRPSVLDDYGLLAAIRWYGERFSRRTGIEVRVEGEELVSRLPTEVETELFRICQEALTNVAKHAEASEVVVTVDAEDEEIHLVVRDNGTGFDHTALQDAETLPGWGLMSMRERALAVGGRLLVGSEPGSGTRIAVELGR